MSDRVYLKVYDAGADTSYFVPHDGGPVPAGTTRLYTEDEVAASGFARKERQ
jgi:hypothetical protein